MRQARKLRQTYYFQLLAKDSIKTATILPDPLHHPAYFHTFYRDKKNRG